MALIGTKTKRKSLITVALSLIFIAAYYYAYGMAAGLLQEIAFDPQKTGEWFKGRFSPLYHMGLAAEGNPVSMLYVSALVISLFALVYAGSAVVLIWMRNTGARIFENLQAGSF